MLEKKVLTPLNGVTATTTSAAIPLDDVKRISFEFVRADHSSGSSKFEVFGSVDGVNFDTAVMMIQNAANTNTQTLIRAISTTLSSNGSEFWYMDEFMCFKAIKIKATETTDGTHTVRVCMQIVN